MPEPKKIPLEIDCQTVKSMLDTGADFLFVDCREADEYQRAHIATAQLVPMSAIQERLGELEPHRNREIVVHCHHGGRSLRVTNWLRGQGFENVKSMAGGIDQWSQQIDPSVPRY
ncbi:MAG: rhodanese-like domain-containing protein [Planctomycetes bacterium]|nr:rhodanese-like domain-containing protein [Planctomycetota bacterium]